MRWPWSKSPSDHDSRNLSWTSLADWQQRFRDPANLVPSVLATAAALGAVAFYKTYLRRIPTVDHIKPKAFRQRSVFGQVTRVGDADNFHLFHTPGGRLAGWGWLPWRRVPEEKKELKARTIHVRIAGVDAPELAHFGRPEQPFAEEAFRFLTEYIHNRRVRAYIYRRDQYDRVVASVFVWRWLVRKDVGLEMLKRGLATVYEAKSGSEFGVWEEKYREAEAAAKRAKVGMWREPGLFERVLGEKKRVAESPRDYKTRMAALEKSGKEGSGNGKGNGSGNGKGNGSGNGKGNGSGNGKGNGSGNGKK